MYTKTCNNRKMVNFNSLVIYHNKLNLVPLLNFAPIEHDLLFSMFKDFKYNDDQSLFFWSIEEVQEILKQRKLSRIEAIQVMQLLKEKFFHCDFKLILPRIDRHIHLFSYMDFEYYDIERTKIKGITVEINPYAMDLFKGLTKAFTSFDLVVFKSLRSSYSKNLFRYLSQYSYLGKAEFDYNEFRELMDIPKSYDYKTMKRNIINQCIRELSIVFKGLQFNPIKEHNYNNELAYKKIVFTFKPYKNYSDNVINVNQPSTKDRYTLFELELSDDNYNKIGL